MRRLRWSMILAAIMLVAVAQQASAQTPLLALLDSLLAKRPILLGTTGACNNDFPGGPCTQNSTLVKAALCRFTSGEARRRMVKATCGTEPLASLWA